MPTSSADDEAGFLRVESLSAGYSATPTIREISLTVGRGETVAVIGPNGAGKSTLLKAILGVIPIQRGKVRLGDGDITGLATDELARRGVGYVPQVRDVFDTLSVEENLKMGGYLLDAKRLHERLRATLDLFPTLQPMLHRPAQKLSGGERKLLAFARVMMLDPQLLVLDEPTSNLSPALSATLLREHVVALAKTGAAVLMVEQKAKAALEVADRAYVLVAGRVQRTGNARQLLEDPEVGQMFLGHSGPDSLSEVDESEAKSVVGGRNS